MELAPANRRVANAEAHARQVQFGIAALSVLLTLLPSLLWQLVEPYVSSQVFANICVVAALAVISIYASWSAIWIVLGPGRWLSRVIRTLVVYHLSLALSLSLTFALYQGNAWTRWIDVLAAFAGMSYGFGIQILAYSFVIWLLQLARYRLLYFDRAAAHFHPRRLSESGSPADATILASRIYLADVFALTALIAVYLAAWSPLGKTLEDNRLFGAPFLFVLAIAACCFGALVGLVLALLPIFVSMLDHRGWRFQIAFHSANLLATCTTLAILFRGRWLDEDAAITCIATAVAVASLLGRLAWIMRTPTDRFRFRIARLIKQRP